MSIMVQVASLIALHVHILTNQSSEILHNQNVSWPKKKIIAKIRVENKQKTPHREKKESLKGEIKIQLMCDYCMIITIIFTSYQRILDLLERTAKNSKKI